VRLLRLFLLVLLPLSWTMALPSAAQPCADVTPPDLVVTSPARAEALSSGGVGSTLLTVEGTATDAESDLVSLVVDGVELLGGPASQSEAFAVDVLSRWGLNVVVASATDACGNRREVVHPFLRSGDYAEPATTPASGATNPTAIVAQLNQTGLDDGNRNDLDDLASLAQAGLAGTDWNTLVPVTLIPGSAPSCGLFGAANALRVTRGTIAAGALTVDSLRATNDGLRARVRLASLSVPLSVRAWLCTATIVTSYGPLTGSISTTNPTLTATIDVTLVGNRAVMTVHSLNPLLSALSVTVDCFAIIQWACDGVSDLVVPLLQGIIEDALADALQDEIAPLVEDFFDGFALAERYVAAPPVDVSVNVLGSLDLLDFAGPEGAGRARIGLSAQIHPDARGAGIPDSAPGAIRRGAAAPSFSTSGYALGLWLQDDLVNQALWALWYGGGLDLPDLRDEAAARGLDVEALAVFAHLPPVLMPGDEPGKVAFGIGDLEVTALVDVAKLPGAIGSGLAALTVRASGFVHGTLGVDAAAQKLDFDASGATVEVELLEPHDPALAAVLSPLLEHLVAAWLPSLVQDLVRSIALPVFPAGVTGYVLGIEDASVDRPTDGATRIVGAFGAAPECGDGAVIADETCDDGNRRAGDGCDDACRIEPRWSCMGQPSVCAPLCGNGVRDHPGEQCDDGNTTDGDGCSASCRLEGVRNLLANSHFDADLSSWQDDSPSGSAIWVDQDVDDRSGSGSAQLTGSPAATLLSECVALGTGDTALLRGWYRRDAGSGSGPLDPFGVELFADPGCASAPWEAALPIAPAGDWQFGELVVDLTANGGARSARVSLGANSSVVLYDSVELVPEPSHGASLAALAALAWLARRRPRPALSER
jgi:cysteine-rich repeat protein